VSPDNPNEEFTNHTSIKGTSEKRDDGDVDTNRNDVEELTLRSAALHAWGAQCHVYAKIVSFDTGEN
jgi:hypothetical protein